MYLETDKKSGRMTPWILGGVLALFVAAVFWGFTRSPDEHSKQISASANMAAPASGATQGSVSVSAADGNAASADPNAAKVGDLPYIVIEGDVVKFYFALGKSDLASGAEAALEKIVAAVKSGKKAQISGYHDASGSASVNAEIAKNRALVVASALKTAGVAQDKIILAKPAQTQGGANEAEARRVEVTLVK